MQVWGFVTSKIVWFSNFMVFYLQLNCSISFTVSEQMDILSVNLHKITFKTVCDGCEHRRTFPGPRILNLHDIDEKMAFNMGKEFKRGICTFSEKKTQLN